MAATGSFIAAVDFGELLGSFGIDWHLLVIQSLNFLIVSLLLYRFGFKNVMKLMDERAKTIESGLMYADKMRKEMTVFENTRSQRMEVVRQEAEEIIKSAKSDAREIFEQDKLKASKMAEGIVSAAKKEATLQYTHSLQKAKSDIGQLVIDVAQGVLAQRLTSEQRQSYISAAEKALLSENLA